MGLEDEFCPYCGKPNPYAKQHQQEIRKYQRSYRETQQEVLKKSRRFAAYAAKLTVLAALLAANLVVVILAVRAWDIGYSFREKKIEAESPIHRDAMEEFLAQGDYAGFAGYMSANGVSMAESLEEYSALYRVSSRYVSILTDLSAIANPEDFRFREEYRADNCAYLAKNIQDLYTVESEYVYRSEIYLSEDKQAHIDTVRHRVELLLASCLGFTEEEIRAIPAESKSVLTEVILEKVAAIRSGEGDAA